jgi:hypothetical protein
VLAMSVLAGAVGYYATVGLTPLTTKLTAGVSFGDEPGLPASLIRLGLWHGVFCLALLGGLLGLRRLPAGGLAIPTILLIVAFGLAEPARYAVHLSQPHYTVRDASRAIAVYAREQGIDRGTILGNTADTFAQETELFAFTIRRWKERNSYMNLDGYARFKPDFVLEMRRTAEFPLELVEQKQPHLRLVKSWDIGPPERRQMGRIGLYQVVGSPPLGAEEEPQSGVID